MPSASEFSLLPDPKPADPKPDKPDAPKSPPPPYPAAGDAKGWAAWEAHLKQMDLDDLAVMATNIGGEVLSDIAAAATGRSGATTKPKPMTWREALKLAEDHCAHNDFPGVNALASIVRGITRRTCSTSTIRKAIKNSAKLQTAKKRAKAMRKDRSVSAMTMSEATAALAAQAMNPDSIEADDTEDSPAEVLNRLIEAAKPSERPKLESMTISEFEKHIRPPERARRARSGAN